MSQPSCSLDPKDYSYCEPTPELIAREQRKLFQQGGLFSSPAERPGAWDGKRSGPLAAHPAAPDAQPCSLAGHDDSALFSREHDAVMHDLFGAPEECKPSSDGLEQEEAVAAAAPAAAGSKEPGADQSDASTSTQHHDEEEEQDNVDLLFSDGGAWRDWMALDWQHQAGMDWHASAAAGGECGNEATSPPGTFLKLNHEATALAINCALHKPLA